MTTLRNMRIGVRLALGFSVVLALMLAMALLGTSRMANVQEHLREVITVNNAMSLQLQALRVAVSDAAIAARNLMLMDDPAGRQAESERIKAQRRASEAAREKMAKVLAANEAATPAEKALFAKIGQLEASLAPLVEKAAGLGLENRKEEATAVLLKEVRPVQRELLAVLSEFEAEEERITQSDAAGAEHEYAQGRLLMFALCGVAIAVGALLAWLSTRSVTRPLGHAVAVAQAVAGGDLTTQVAVTSRDETGQLMQALRAMNDGLARVVGQVRLGTDTIATASTQIASGNQDLSQRTEEQAASLEETAASMEELTVTVKQNAENARQANQLARSACDVAAKGGSVVGQVVDTMTAINDSSRKVVDIISVIDGIAFQTNILALNAAVEAARAGEQGRGFAVVAAEVRSLAQRSAAAAKEIKGLIDNSVEKVGAGSELVQQAGTTMQEVVSSIRRVTDIMGEIAAASQQQTAGIEQVNQAITQMDQVTQQNAALVEEAAAAAQSMREQAASLVEAVGLFRIGTDAQAQRVISDIRAASKVAPKPVAAAVRRPAARPPEAPRRAEPAPDVPPSTNTAAGREEDWTDF